MLVLKGATSSLINDEISVEYEFAEGHCLIDIIWSNRDTDDMVCNYHVKEVVCRDNTVLNRMNNALLLGMDDGNKDVLLYLEMISHFDMNDCVDFPKSKEIQYHQLSNKMFVANTPKASVIMNKVPNIDGKIDMLRILRSGKVSAKDCTDDITYIPLDLEDFLLRINKNTSLNYSTALLLS